MGLFVRTPTIQPAALTTKVSERLLIIIALHYLYFPLLSPSGDPTARATASSGPRASASSTPRTAIKFQLLPVASRIFYQQMPSPSRLLHPQEPLQHPNRPLLPPLKQPLRYYHLHPLTDLQRTSKQHLSYYLLHPLIDLQRTSKA